MFVDGNGNSLSTSNFIVIDPWLNDVFEFDILMFDSWQNLKNIEGDFFKL